MPDFLSDFASSLNQKKGIMRDRILLGTPNLLKDRFEKHFDSHWIMLNEVDRFSCKPSTLNVMAIDASVYTNLLSTGGIFYIIRSLAVCGAQSQKLLETDVVFTKASLLDAQRFISMKMELLEFQVALNALKGDFNCERILFDGSLYGRAVHLPIESKIEEQRLMLLDYVRTYRELLDFCKNKGIAIIGVSKESRAAFYRDYLLKIIFNDELDNLSPQIDPLDLQKLKPLFSEILENEDVALNKFSKISKKYGKELDTVKLIFEELASARPDYQLIMRHAKCSGYTKPLLLGPSVRAAKVLDYFRKDPAKFVRSRFPVTYRRKGKEFVDYAINVLSSMETFPGIVSFHLLLDLNDSPIRIDVPDWSQTFSKTGWPKPIDFNVENLLKVLVTGYCGLDCHNLWLKNVDERVRLKKRVVDTIYFPFMEKQFNAKIIRGRSYRRVKYP